MNLRARMHGELEMAVMDILWETGGALSARQVQALFEVPVPAITTVSTVIERLRTKGWVSAVETPRAKLYSVTRSREAHTAELMANALTTTGDRTAALMHFAGTLTDEERAVLRTAIARDPHRPEKR
jgi:predicted transcriptional regulator